MRQRRHMPLRQAATTGVRRLTLELWKLKGIPGDWTVCQTPTGSMIKSKGWSGGPNGDQNDEVKIGTMVVWARHCTQVVRDALQLPKEYPIIHLLDHASCHEDDIAGSILAEDNQWIRFAPSETSHFLQIGDTIHINSRLQTAKRSLVDARD